MSSMNALEELQAQNTEIRVVRDDLARQVRECATKLQQAEEALRLESMQRKQADGLFINTAGVGVMQADWPIGQRYAQAGDMVLLSGPVGNHGIAIMLVRGACEILGLDPLTIANEGKLLAIVAKESASAALAVMQEHPLARQAAIVGEVRTEPNGMVFLRTELGGTRVLDMLVGDPLPRIC